MEIESESAYIGGIVGYLQRATLEECFHIGDIKTSKEANGICGRYGWGTGLVTAKNCYNNGNKVAASGEYSMTVSGKNSYTVNSLVNEEEKKVQSFVDELNTLTVTDSEGVTTETIQNVWVMDTEGINNGYPIFAWQLENAK